MTIDLYLQRIVDTCHKNKTTLDIAQAMVISQYIDERDHNLDKKIKEIIRNYEMEGIPLCMHYPVSEDGMTSNEIIEAREERARAIAFYNNRKDTEQIIKLLEGIKGYIDMKRYQEYKDIHESQYNNSIFNF